jgi:hypothetical protein
MMMMMRTVNSKTGIDFSFLYPKVLPTGVGSLGVLPNVRPLDAIKMLTVATRKKESDRKIVVSCPGLLNKKTF